MTVIELYPHLLERSVTIHAKPRIVFGFFTDSERWARWWGQGSLIDARPGGRMLICYPNGPKASGEVQEVRAPEQIAFTYGYESGIPIASGRSRVTIRLEAIEAGTRLHLVHEFFEPEVRDQHIAGWRFQLSVFCNLVADEVFASASAVVDAWFQAWEIPDDHERLRAFEKIAVAQVRFNDRFSALESLSELSAHAGAAQRFMPGVQLRRDGVVRHCQGAVLVNWNAVGGGNSLASGTNLFMLDQACRIVSVVGFSGSPG
jgi:uncharacterized protein YndB with AHSA1/START domain